MVNASVPRGARGAKIIDTVSAPALGWQPSFEDGTPLVERIQTSLGICSGCRPGAGIEGHGPRGKP